MKFYQVSSFTKNVFKGNPAGVCLIVGDKLPSYLMQEIAALINLSETAFVFGKEEDFDIGELEIRWFTPTTEVKLCGHATLAAAHIMYENGYIKEKITFKSELHTLYVKKKSDRVVLDFPVSKLIKVENYEVPNCFNFTPTEIWRGIDDYLLVFENQFQIEQAVCDIAKAKDIDLSGLIITAKANLDGYDFVSRYFGPKIGINEDPVTGSAHTLLVPYWQKIFKKDIFHAAQISPRGGEIFCIAKGNRVEISGYAVTFLIGEIML